MTLQALYKFEGNANDSSGKGRNLTTVGSPTYLGGRIGSQGANLPKVAYPGASNYFTSTSNIGINGGNCTMGIWVKYSYIGADYDLNWHFEQWSASADAGFATAYSNGSKLLYWRRRKTGGASDDVTFSYTATTGVWLHMMLTYDGTTLVAYLNGQKKGIKACSGSGAGSSDAFVIGCYWNNHGGGPSYQTPGIFDEFICDDTAWTEAQVRQYYTSSVGYYTPTIS